ncbi:MAG: AAA family ATPase, partial [Phycisphaerae bacterium]
EYIPTVAGCEVFDDPLRPQFRQARQIVAEMGERTEVRWVHRDERYHEKLATPDVTIADLIGEIDLVKHAEGRYLADESVMHFGLIPRTNRGIFAINELPDLAPRIQVGLFNVLEERDVQIRGFPVRLPLDVVLVFTANPEDYTSRGRIVTPLKDRIGSVIRTHYPQTLEDALAITAQNAWLDRSNGRYRIEIPRYMQEIIEELARLARSSPHINQQSGVSVRTSIANAENMVSNAERRALLFDEALVVPRISDLSNLTASCRGKIELILADDPDSEEKLIFSLLGEAVKNVFENYLELDGLEPIVEGFGRGKAIEVGDDLPSQEVVRHISTVRGLKKAAKELLSAAKIDRHEPAYLASAGEFVLEALYVNNRLSKYAYRRRTYYKR